MRRIIIIIITNGRHGFPGIFPAKVVKVLREASALMRISSILYIIIYIYISGGALALPM